MEYFVLKLVRNSMDNIPQVSCPKNFNIQLAKNGEEHEWARIETRVGEFPNELLALQRFQEFYGSSWEGRCFSLENENHQVIGTASAWQGDFEGEERGRLSWVAITPEYQGKGLAKPLLTTVMNNLAQRYSKAFLTTQTTSYQAVNLYLNFGFIPHLTNEESRKGWKLMEQVLSRQIL